MRGNNHKEIIAAINKLEREGLTAPFGASIQKAPKREGCHQVRFRGKEKGPNDQTTLYLGRIDDPRYEDWAGRIERRNRYKVLMRGLKFASPVDAARLIANKEAKSQEWYTPLEFIELARKVLGEIDLDPASNATAQEGVKAANFYTKEDDGLSQPWQGRIWCNPPYGQWTELFIAKGLKEYQAGNAAALLFLINQSDAAWLMDVEPKFSLACKLRKRIRFIQPDGTPGNSPGRGQLFLYLGDRTGQFRENFEPIGKVYMP